MKKFLSIIYTAVFLAACALALVACDVVAEADVDRLMRKCNSHEEIQLVDAAAFTDVFIQTDVYSVYVTESDFRGIITLDYAEISPSAIRLRIVPFPANASIFPKSRSFPMRRRTIVL